MSAAVARLRYAAAHDELLISSITVITAVVSEKNPETD